MKPAYLNLNKKPHLIFIAPGDLAETGTESANNSAGLGPYPLPLPLSPRTSHYTHVAFFAKDLPKSNKTFSSHSRILIMYNIMHKYKKKKKYTRAQ